MNFLLNMNIPPSLGQKLPQPDHSFRHVRDIGMAAASDSEIIEEAQRQHEIVVTHDLDYGTLLAFSGASWPSVVIFRVRNTHPNALFARLMRDWSNIEKRGHYYFGRCFTSRQAATHWQQAGRSLVEAKTVSSSNPNRHLEDMPDELVARTRIQPAFLHYIIGRQSN